MTDSELRTYHLLLAITSAYSEDAPISQRKATLDEVNKIAEVCVDQFTLDTFWSSRSLKSFCKNLSIERASAGSLNTSSAADAVSKIFENLCEPETFDYLLAKYAESLAYHYRMTEGQLEEIILDERHDCLEQVLTDLRKARIIYQ